jgi:hypothetical protein
MNEMRALAAPSLRQVRRRPYAGRADGLFLFSEDPAGH